MFKGNVLDFVISTDPHELAGLLDDYADDWAAVLDFLESLAWERGILLDVEKIQEILKERYKD